MNKFNQTNLIIMNMSLNNNWNNISNLNLYYNNNNNNDNELIQFTITLSITIIYFIIFISGLLGNIITCIVIAKNRGMHTATNYYLFSLAISDLLLLISGMPLETYDMWITTNEYPINEPFCVIIKLVSETSANATVLTITAFTAERYIAICHPFLSHTMSKLSRAVKFIFGIWLLAMGLAIPQIWDVGITYHELDPPYEEYVDCSHQNNDRRHFFTISVILCFALPMFVITLFYMLIGIQLRRSKIVGRAARANGNSIKLKPFQKQFHQNKRHILVTINDDDKHNENLLIPNSNHQHICEIHSSSRNHNNYYIDNIEIQHLNSTPTRLIVCNDDGRKNFSHNSRVQGSRHVINMLVAVVVAFFICWAPHHVQRIYAMYADPNSDTHIFQIITQISGILYYLSTCVNPLLYNIMSFKFREAFKDTSIQCCSSKEPSDFKYKKNNLILNRRNIQGYTTSQNSSSYNNIKSSIKSTTTSSSLGQQEYYLYNSNISITSNLQRPIIVKFKKFNSNNKNRENINMQECFD